MRVFMFIIISALACNVQAMCENHQNCNSCTQNSCVWYEGSLQSFCGNNFVPKNTYKTKVRTSSKCQKETKAPVAPSIEPTNEPTDVSPQIQDEKSPIQEHIPTINTIAYAEVDVAPSILIEENTNQEDEKGLRRQLQLHECHAYGIIRKLRYMKRGRTMSEETYKKVVRRCMALTYCS